MNKTSETVVFFGSGPVAARSLELLLEHTAVEAVVTKPKPTHHRGEFPVLELAAKQGLTTYTPSNKKELSELFTDLKTQSQAGLVIDYGIIIAQDVINHFPLGIINSHFSLLPEWRGADPISFAILSGQKHTGVSLMLIVEALDEGPVFAFGVEELNGTETTPELTERLVLLSDSLLKQELPRYLTGEAQAFPQEQLSTLITNHPAKPTYSRKLTKEDGLIDWHKPAEQIEREIRAFIEWPKSRTTIAGKEVIITKAHVAGYEYHPDPSDPPEAFETPDGFIGMPSLTKGVLVIEKLKPIGKKEMTAEAFLAGHRHLLQ